MQRGLILSQRCRGRLEEPFLEDARFLRLVTQRPLGDVIGLLVRAARDMLQFQTLESFFNLTYLFQVCLHVLVLRRILLVGEVGEELGVSLDGEALNPQGGCGLEAGD